MESSSRNSALVKAAAAALFAAAAWTAVPATHAAPYLQERPDADSDGLYDDDEYNVYGTDAYNWDSDGDGKSDGEEVYVGTDPTVWDHEAVSADTDGDGLYDLDEAEIYGTDSYAWDSDGDGRSDGDEVSASTDPLLNEDLQPPLPPCGLVPIPPCV